ncbi:MAG: hypothetical protein ACI30M_06715 [Muribaculaceae bacterium]
MSKRSEKYWLWAMTIGMLLIVAGTMLPIFHVEGEYFAGEVYKYVYTAGAAILLLSRLFSGYKGENDRLRRLYRIESWSAIFFCVAAFFMFYSEGARDWLAFTLAGGAIQVYTSIMIPRVARKEENK